MAAGAPHWEPAAFAFGFLVDHGLINERAEGSHMGELIIHSFLQENAGQLNQPVVSKSAFLLWSS